MQLHWRNGVILASFLVIGIVGASIFAKQHDAQRVEIARVGSDDGRVGSDDARKAIHDTAPVVAITPSAVSPIATFTAKNRTGDARNRIPVDARATHTLLTINLKQRLPQPITVTIAEYRTDSIGGNQPRTLDRFIRLATVPLNPAHVRSAVLRIVIPTDEQRRQRIPNAALTIATYNTERRRWIPIPSTVDIRHQFISAVIPATALRDGWFTVMGR